MAIEDICYNVYNCALKLTSVVRALNYVKWAEFSNNRSLSSVASGNNY